MLAELYPESPKRHYQFETGIFQWNKVNAMSADALLHHVTSPSADRVLAMSNIDIHVFPQGWLSTIHGFQCVGEWSEMQIIIHHDNG